MRTLKKIEEDFRKIDEKSKRINEFYDENKLKKLKEINLVDYNPLNRYKKKNEE